MALKVSIVNVGGTERLCKVDLSSQRFSTNVRNKIGIEIDHMIHEQRKANTDVEHHKHDLYGHSIL